MKKLKVGAYFSDPIPSDPFSFECGVWIVLEVQGPWLNSRWVGRITRDFAVGKIRFDYEAGGLCSDSYFKDLHQVPVTGELLKEIEAKTLIAPY